MTGRWDGTTLRWPDHPMLHTDTPYRLVTEDVLGVPMEVFEGRLRSYRELVAASSAHGDAVAFVFGDRRVTFRGHERLVASAAAGLASRHGVGPGDRVALLGSNTIDWIVAFGAITALGATAVALNGWWTATEVQHAIELTTPSLLFADRKRAERLVGSAVTLPVLLLEDEVALLETFAPDAPLPDHPIDEDDPAVILFTSGTTGRSKGAISSHRNLLMLATNTSYNQLRTQIEYPDFTPAFAPCSLSQLPLFHVSGLHGSLVHTLSLGQRSVWPIGRFDEINILELTERERVTTWSVVASQLLRILEHPDFGRYNLSSLGYVGGGGSSWPPELVRRVHTLLPQVVPAMSYGYGMTESSGMGTVNIGPTVASYPASVGAPRPTCEVQIRSDDESRSPAAVLPEGVEGEIYMRGPCVFLGYHDNAAATAQTIVEDRWLRTGDLGWIQDGLVYISTRRTDLIIRGAENVYPIEIENRLMEHPDVVEAAVFGVPHRVLGQQVKAVVQVRAGTHLDVAELQEWLGREMAAFKVPSLIDFRTEPFPRNATGKVLKHVLRGDANSTFIED